MISMTKSRFSIPLHYQILIMLIAGGFFGYFFHDATIYTDWVGEIFLRALNMIIIPLILCSITTGVASVGNADNLGRLGIKTMGFYVFSTLAAILTGFFLVRIIIPELEPIWDLKYLSVILRLYPTVLALPLSKLFLPIFLKH